MELSKYILSIYIILKCLTIAAEDYTASTENEKDTQGAAEKRAIIKTIINSNTVFM
jgi:hypothetical protein